QVASVTLERAPDPSGPWTTLSLAIRLDGGSATALDASASAGVLTWYRLNVVRTDGTRSVFGPISSREEPAIAGSRLSLSPNPTAGPLRIDFEMPRAGAVRILVADVAGRIICPLLEGSRPAGRTTLSWDGRDASGSRIPAGVYFVRMETSERVMRRFVRVR